MKKVIAIAITAAFAGAANGTGYFTHDVASGYQAASGSNYVSARSESTGTGSAYNAAGSSLTLHGYTNVNVGTAKIPNMDNGKVKADTASARIGQDLTAQTLAVSANSGQGTGYAYSGAHADGYGRARTNTFDFNYQNGVAGSQTLGFMSNEISAVSFAHDYQPSPNNVKVSEHNANSGSIVDLESYAGVDKNGAVAGDSKKVETWTATFSTGIGYSDAESRAHAHGSSYETTWGFDY